MSINKYLIRWQSVRIAVKQTKSLESKFKILKSYFQEYGKSCGDKERIINLLKGLKLGYKDNNRRIEVQIEVNRWESLSCNEADAEDVLLTEVKDKRIFDVLKDLHVRNAKWLKKGYVHGQQIQFMRNIGQYLVNNSNTDIQCKARNILQQLEQGILNAPPSCTHRFLY